MKIRILRNREIFHQIYYKQMLFQHHKIYTTMKHLSYSRRSIRFMKIATTVGTFFAIIPNYDFDKMIILRKKLYGLYTLTVFFISIAIFSIGSYSALDQGLYSIKISEFVMSVVVECNMLALFVLASLGSAFWNTDRWKYLFRSFAHLERHLNTEMRMEKSILRNVYLQYCVLNFMITINLGTLVAGEIEDLNSDVSVVFLVYTCFLFYIKQMRETLMYNLILAIKCKYQDLNDFLIKGCGGVNTDAKKTVRIVSEFYGIMNEIVDNFNKIFGWELLLSLMLSFTLQLSSFYFINVKLFKGISGTTTISKYIKLPLIATGTVSVVSIILCRKYRYFSLLY